MSDTQEIKSYDKPSCKVSNAFFLFSLIALMICGLSFVNIVDFWIEDYFKIPLSDDRNIFDFIIEGNRTYAHKISWQIVSLACFLILFLWDRFLLRKDPSALFSRLRKKGLTFLIILFLTVMLVILVSLIYSYFSGQTEPYGLLRVGVVLGAMLLGVLFFYFEMAYHGLIVKTAYQVLVSILMVGSLVFSLFLLQAYGSPALMRTARQDIETNENMNRLLDLVNNHFLKTDSLPESLDDVLNYPRLKNDDFETITYIVKNDASFQICGTFKLDWQSARRLKTYWHFDKYTQGENCRTYHVKRHQNDKKSIEIETYEGARVTIK